MTLSPRASTIANRCFCEYKGFWSQGIDWYENLPLELNLLHILKLMPKCRNYLGLEPIYSDKYVSLLMLWHWITSGVVIQRNVIITPIYGVVLFSTTQSHKVLKHIRNNSNTLTGKPLGKASSSYNIWQLTNYPTQSSLQNWNDFKLTFGILWQCFTLSECLGQDYYWNVVIPKQLNDLLVLTIS